jgi:hypothetical protein
MPKKKKEVAQASEKHEHKHEATVHEKPAKQGALFAEVKPENYFVLCDGKTVKDYRELARLLETMSDDVFFYHVTSDRNDFANWINDVFKEEDLASNIRSSKSRIEMIAMLYKKMFEKLEKML